jgi:catechol 2,3-dioxygenase-like lactoylglutathione lyase family enzyme
MIRKLAHLCLLTDQLETMRAFYADTLGLPVKIVFHNAAQQIFGYYFDCGDSTFIEIFDRVLKSQHWGGTPQDLTAGGRFNHLCLEVTGLPDVRAAFLAKGLQVSPVKSVMDHSLQAWAKDPDGNSIEFMEYTAQSLQLQQGQQLAK